MPREYVLMDLEKEQLIHIIKQQQSEQKMYEEAVGQFIEKNFKGGPKSSREDYSTTVSCKDLWELREVFLRLKKDES